MPGKATFKNNSGLSINMEEELTELIKAAKREKWEKVDSKIPFVCNSPSVQRAAGRLLRNKDRNVRDLAASI